MTAKRFTFKTKTQGNQAYTQWYDNGKPINSAHEVIDLLNYFNRCTVSNKEFMELKEENERLRKGIDLLQEENDDLNKFFLHNCKTSDYLKWKKEEVE